MRLLLITLFCLNTCLIISSDLTEMQKVEQKELAEQKQDELLFITGLGILVQMIQIFLDPTNIPKVTGHVSRVLEGIYQFAQYAIANPLHL